MNVAIFSRLTVSSPKFSPLAHNFFYFTPSTPFNNSPKFIYSSINNKLYSLSHILFFFYSEAADEEWNTRALAAIILILSVITILSTLTLLRIDCLYDPD